MFIKYGEIDVTFNKWYIWALEGQFMSTQALKSIFMRPSEIAHSFLQKSRGHFIAVHFLKRQSRTNHTC